MLNDIHIPANMAHYRIFRNMYYGGRVLATIAKYDSKSWNVIAEMGDLCKDLDTILDCRDDDLTQLKKTDVVSLYPSVMEAEEFPTGKYSIHVVDEKRRHTWAEEVMLMILERKKGSDEKKKYLQQVKRMFQRSFFMVDMDCDEKMLIAFVMRRRELDNRPEQTIGPLRKHWLSGMQFSIIV